MTFDEAMQDAAKRADKAVATAMRQYRYGWVHDEDDLTGVLVGALTAEFDNSDAGSLRWSASILRHRRGRASEEGRIGADLLIHVRLDTPSHSYSKGVLAQAKRVEPDARMFGRDFADLKKQCEKMIAVTPAAFVLDYTKSSMRCGAATKIAGCTDPNLYAQCDWTSYRFFRELFRCPIGDPRITSASVADLPVERELHLTAVGVLDEEAARR